MDNRWASAAAADDYVVLRAVPVDPVKIGAVGSKDRILSCTDNKVGVVGAGAGGVVVVITQIDKDRAADPIEESFTDGSSRLYKAVVCGLFR